MTAIILPGQAGAIDDINVTQAQFREQIAAIATAARRYTGGTSQGVSTTCLYVDPEIGIDTWQSGIADGTASPVLTNQQITAGYSKTAPFKTLQRALIEAARISIVSGGANDLYDRVVIRVSPGEHIIDNAPAGSETVSPWGSSFSPTAENLRAFNGSSIGVILPRGVSVVGEDLRKTVIRPSTVPAANLNPSTQRGSIFKSTGGSFFFNFTFKDALGITTSHHLLSAFEFCSDTELTAYYNKVATAFGLNPSDIELINPGETQITTVYPDGGAVPEVDSTRGSSPYVFNCSLRSDYGMCGMFLDGSKVTGFKSMVVAQFTNVSLQKDMNAWQVYSGGAWNVPANYAAYISSNINDVRYRIGGAINHRTGCYEVDYRSFGFKCINDAIIQEVSCFVIGDAVHHWTASGGECTITNSNSNFGLTALLSSGFRGIGTATGAFSQDQGFQMKELRRALKVPTDGSNIRQITLGTVASYNSATGAITLNSPFDPSVTFGRYGYSLKQGDYLWIENRSRDTGPGFVPGDKEASSAIDVRATLAATPWTEGSANVINVTVSNDLAVNNIGTMDPSVLVGNRVYIRRLVDTRTPEERKYSLIVENSNPGSTRRPLGNFVVRLGGKSNVANQLDPTNKAGELFLVSESSVGDTGGVSTSNFKIVVRPGDSASTFQTDTYYRLGSSASNAGRIYRSKRNDSYSSFSLDAWEPSLPMLANERGIEALRLAIAPELIIDKDLSNNPSSTDLGVDQLTDPDVLNQMRSATDYRGVRDFMLAVGYTSTDVTAILQPQDSASSRAWDPSALSSPAPTGKLSARGYWPLEFNRPSLIRAFGQAYEWAGQGNYSKAMPKYQVTALSDQHKIDYFAVNHFGGRVYNTGFNEDGLIVQGDTINDLSTNTVVTTETAGLGALGGDPDFPAVPTSFDSLTITSELNSLESTNLNNVTINGIVSGSPTFEPNVLPVATAAVAGIIELATAAETALLNDINKAVTPATLGAIRGAIDGLASLDSNGQVPLDEIPNLPATKLPDASTTQKGVLETATNAEAAAYAATDKALVPSNLAALRAAASGIASLDDNALVPLTQVPNIPAAKLPNASTTAQGIIELATNAEAAGYAATDRALVPSNLAALRGAASGIASLDGSSKLPSAQLPTTIPSANLPGASISQIGGIEIATNAEAAAFSATDKALVPSNLAAVRGAASGIASLDGNALVPLTQVPNIPATKLPDASTTAKGVVELATDAEAAGYAATDRALVPSNLAALRGAASGIASLDGSSKLPSAQLPATIPSANLPAASTSQIGGIEIATNAEAAAFVATDKALVPSNLGAIRGAASGIASLDANTLVPLDQLPNIPATKLPDASTTAKGVVELATDAEAAGYTALNLALTPSNLSALRGAASGIASLDGSSKLPSAQLPTTIPSSNLPLASTTQIGGIEIATNAEAAAFSATDKALVPSNLAAVRGAANGLASLDESSLVPLAQVPVLPAAKLPSASTAQSGIIEIATDGEAVAYAATDRALVPSNLAALRGAASGIASLDASSRLPTTQLPTTIPSANLSAASTTQIGAIEIATNTEAAAYTDSTRALVPSNLAALRGAANGLATLDGTSLLPVAQLPEIPLANIPVLTNAKIPTLELGKIPTLPANKLLTTPVAWTSGATNFDLSANFTFAHSGTATSLALGVPVTTGYIGTSGFIYVTNTTGVALVGIDNADWKPITNTWVNPVDNTTGLTGNLLIGYYIAAANTVVYTASMVS